MGKRCNYNVLQKLITDLIACRCFQIYKYMQCKNMYTVHCLKLLIKMQVHSNIKWDLINFIALNVHL